MHIRSLPTATIFAFALSAAASPALHAQESGIAIGAPAPGAMVKTLNGKQVDLASYVGKSPVVMEFWAHWCSSCKQLEPSLLSLQKKYGSRVKFLGVAVSVNQSLARVKAYTAKHKYTHETVFDSDGNAAEAYDVPATSYVVVLDSEGRVVYTGLGGKQSIEPAIVKALAVARR